VTAKARWRRAVGALGSRVNAMSYLAKWMILAPVIGIIAGLGAMTFYEALRVSTHLFLGLLAGYHVPTPAGEGNAAGSTHYSRAWAIPLVVTLGALASGFLVFSVAPEAEGHGTDAAIDAVHHNPRGIRLRAVVVKIVASALTIGSGGSGGREGPTAQISAGFGSLLARVLDLSPEDGRIAVSIGIGSGIGAIFSAPLGGAVLAADIVYRDDFEFEALLPGLLSSIVAYAVFGAVFGFQSLFAIPGYQFHQPVQLVWFGLIGLLAGGIGLLYSKTFYGMVSLSNLVPLPKKLRPAAGGLAVGLIALGLPEVLGTGYGWVQKGLGGDLAHTPLLIVLALPLARILATAFSIGTGGSGGVFGPGMVIGAFTGLAVWRVLEPIAPAVGHDPAPFVVVGMMAVFGGISRAPIAVMLMVAQMTGSIALLGPAMVAVAISWFIVGRADDSIYRAQLRTRADLAAGRLQLGLPLLSTVSVASVAGGPIVVLHDTMSVPEAARALEDAGVPGAPVVDAHGGYLGTVDAGALAVAAERHPAASLAEAVDASTTSVAATASLDVGLEALTQADGSWVTVTDRDHRVAGILAIGDLIRGWRRALDTNVGTTSQVSAHAVAVEERVGPHSELVGRPVRQAGLPAGCVIVTVRHDDELSFATGATTLAAGDVVSALVSPPGVEALRRLLRGSSASGPVELHQGGQLT
jgi:CIC family chloride channel protein